MKDLRPNLSTAAAAMAVFAVFFWAQADDAQRIGTHPLPVAAQAAEEEAEAIASREWAAKQACGPDKTPQWIDDKTLECLRHVDRQALVAEHRP